MKKKKWRRENYRVLIHLKLSMKILSAILLTLPTCQILNRILIDFFFILSILSIFVLEIISIIFFSEFSLLVDNFLVVENLAES
jgi:hypothetical protein